MTQTGKPESKIQKYTQDKTARIQIDANALDATETKPVGIETQSQESLLVKEEINELLGNENLLDAVNKFKADSREKEIALEFANSHIQFLNGIVESDYKKGLSRTDVEIREMVSHVNMMLMKKDDYIFTTMIAHSHSHYRHIQNKFFAKIKKNDGDKTKNT